MWNKILLGVLWSVLPLTVLADVGKVSFTSGAVVVREATGVEKPAANGMSLNQGDTIVTHAGRAQLRFADGGYISLIPNTVFQIKEYHFTGKADGSERSVFGFLKGGLRAITGVIGHQTPGAYRMESAVATIGIRGTEYQAILCEANCKAPDGLYVHVGEGRIFVKNAMGEIELSHGQSGYVPSPESPPKETTTTPSISSAPEAGPTPPSIAGVNAPEFPAGTITSTNGLGNVLAFTGNVGLGIAGLGTATGPDGITSTFFGSGAGAGTVPSGVIAGLYMNGSTPMGGIVTNGSTFASVIMATPPVDIGTAGGLYWGRWVNTSGTVYAGIGSTIQTGTFSFSGSLFYIFNSQATPTIPGTGSATYGFINGSSPGATGISSGNLTADFLGKSVNASLTIPSLGGAGTVQANNMPIDSSGGFKADPNNTPGSSISINGSTGYGKVAGFFAGTTVNAPSYAGLTYHLSTLPYGGGITVAGIGAFKCASGC